MTSADKWLSIALVLLSVAAAGIADDRLLLPVAVGNSPGAYGSIWTSDAWVENTSSAVVTVDTRVACFVECPVPAVDPGQIWHLIVAGEPGGTPGLIAYVPSPAASLLRVNSRIQDLSRQALTWGTEIPVVRESEFKREGLSLLNVPLDSRFRQTLRVYALDAPAGASVTVDFLEELPTTRVVGSIQLPLVRPSENAKYKPYYAQLDSWTLALPQLQAQGRVHLHVRPSADLAIWAFVSVTNDETQHVTTVTPR